MESANCFQNSKIFSLADYQCIGFDLDHSLVTYKLPETFRLIYQSIKTYLVDHLGLVLPREPPADLPLDLSCCQKGLFYDKIHGNVVKLDHERKVSAAVHGRHQVLTPEEIRQTYGPERELIPIEDLEHMFATGFGQLLRPDDQLIIFRER